MRVKVGLLVLVTFLCTTLALVERRMEKNIYIRANKLSLSCCFDGSKQWRRRGRSCCPSEVRVVPPAVDQHNVNTQIHPHVSVTLVTKVHWDLMDVVALNQQSTPLVIQQVSQAVVVNVSLDTKPVDQELKIHLFMFCSWRTPFSSHREGTIIQLNIDLQSLQQSQNFESDWKPLNLWISEMWSQEHCGH